MDKTVLALKLSPFKANRRWTIILSVTVTLTSKNGESSRTHPCGAIFNSGINGEGVSFFCPWLLRWPGEIPFVSLSAECERKTPQDEVE